MSYDSKNLAVDRSSVGACPRCGHRSAESETVQWADVARVSSVAEAGFLADELSGVGIESRVHQLEEFSAATDNWSSKYLIRVPEQFAREAAVHIEQYLFEEEHGRRPILDVLRKPFHANANDAMRWLPVILVVIASFALGQQFSERVPPRGRSANSLPNAIAAIDKQFTTEPFANQPRHRLSFDQRQQHWTLETDRDNDGVYDEARNFPAASIR
jgi:hypothetical protein